jgi:hypothetical protein
VWAVGTVETDGTKTRTGTGRPGRSCPPPTSKTVTR